MIVVALVAVGATAIEEGRGVLGIEPDRRAVVGDRPVVVTLVAVGVASLEENRGVPGIEPDRLAVISDRAIVVALFVVGGTSIAEGKSIFGIEPDRCTEVGDGAVLVALVEPGDASAVEDIAVPLTEPDRFVVVGEGAVGTALVAISETPVVEGLGEGGIEPDRLVEVGDAAFVVALLTIADASVAVGDRLLRGRQFPRIDGLRTGNDSGVGVSQIIARLGGGCVAQERHGGSKCAPESPSRAAHAVSWSEIGIPQYGIGIDWFGSRPTGKSRRLKCPRRAHHLMGPALTSDTATKSLSISRIDHVAGVNGWLRSRDRRRRRRTSPNW